MKEDEKKILMNAIYDLVIDKDCLCGICGDFTEEITCGASTENIRICKNGHLNLKNNILEK